MRFSSLIWLYVAFRMKQFTCDFLLQTDWMALNKGKPGIDGYKALVSHALVHAIGTLLIVLCVAPSLWWLGPLDFVIHGAVDRVKGLLSYHKGWQYTDRMFWWSFGADQEAHNFTHMAYVAIIVMHAGGVHF